MDEPTLRLIKDLQERVEKLETRGLPNDLKIVGDFYANRDIGLGLKARMEGNIAWSNHFNSGAIPAGWAWAGAPFATPSSIDATNSRIRWSSASIAGGRSFLYRSAAPTIQIAHVGVTCFGTTGMSIGLRWDDGSDNNYVEVVLYHNNIAGGQTNTAWLRYRNGGGAISYCTAGWAQPSYESQIISGQCEGTFWTSWAMRQLGYGALGDTGWGSSLSDIPISLTWTPTRCGIIGDANGSNVTWTLFTLDAIYYSS